MKARDLITTGETAVAIFTRGGHFIIQTDGRGQTGNWVMNPRMRLDRVIVYKRDPNDTKHEVYIGTVIDIVESEQPGRWKIEMANIEFAGTTTLNWNEFTETKQGAVNPIKYISAEQTPTTKHPVTKRSAVSETTITPSQLGDWRRAMVQLLNRIDPQGATGNESVAARITRLSRKGVIPREVAAMMHTVREMRNVAEYQSRPLSPDETVAATAAWNIVQEWARKRLESVSLNQRSTESK